MAPTICSGKKRQTHTIATTNIRRRGQGSHQLSQTLSNIVNFVAKGSMKPRVSASLRIRTHKPTEREINSTSNYRNTNHEADLNYSSHLTQTNNTVASCHRRQQFSFISDNAVTSSTHSDTENSFDLRLANEILTTDSTTTYFSDTINPSNATSQSPSSLSETSSSSSHKETSSPTSQERNCQRSSTVMQTNNITGNGGNDSDNEETDSYENDNNNKLNSNRETNKIRHSSNIRNHCFSCSDFDFNEDEESENAREPNCDMSGVGNDADMDADESDSMTSLDTEKSAKLKSSNHPLLRDKILVEQQTNDSSSNTKPFNNIRSTDGLLSIAIKTIKLVKRNQLLQQRLTQLQLETSEFIQSVLANPENRHFRENIKQKVQEVDNV